MLAVSSLVVTFALCAGQSAVDSASSACDLGVIRMVTVNGVRTGWANLWLGMSRSQIEAKVGHQLEIKVHEAQLMEPAFARLEYRGHRLTMMLQGSGEEAILAGLFVRFWQTTTACGRDDQVRALRGAVPDLEYNSYVEGRAESDDETPVYVRSTSPKTGLLLKPMEGLYITPRPWIE